MGIAQSEVAIMGVRIDTRVGVLEAQRASKQATTRTTGATPTTTQRTGSAAADLSSLAIPDRFNTQIKQFTQEVGGLQTGISALQTADKGLSTQQNALEKLKGLAQEAAGGNLTADRQTAIAKQVADLTKSIDATAESATFNNVKLLKPSAKPNTADTAGGSAVNVNASTTESLSVNSLDLSTPENAKAASTAIDAALSRVKQNRANIATQSSRLTQQVEQRQNAINAGQATVKKFQDLQSAQQAVEQTNSLVLSQGQNALSTQGNINPSLIARLLAR
jgi:flagellin